MERLQQAIDKARAQRRQGDLAPSAAKPAASKRRAKEPKIDKSGAAWTALPQIKITRPKLQTNRVVSVEGGPEAAPFDMLRTKVLHQAATNNWKRIAITSPDSNTGKSVATANLAFCLARQPDIRTIAFDFDLRRIGLTKALGQTPGHNMADILEGRVQFRDHALRYGEGVAFGLNNGPVRHSSEILQSKKAAEVLDGIEEEFDPDIMLFDLPPMMATDDNFGFLKYVDCALIVAGAEKTSLDKIDVAERQVAEITNVMGIVLNKCRYFDGAYGYEYGYY